jgi:hypothetical protein
MASPQEKAQYMLYAESKVCADLSEERQEGVWKLLHLISVFVISTVARNGQCLERKFYQAIQAHHRTTLITYG